MKPIIASGVTPPSMSKAAPLAPASRISLSAFCPQPEDWVFSPPKVSQKYSYCSGEPTMGATVAPPKVPGRMAVLPQE